MVNSNNFFGQLLLSKKGFIVVPEAHGLLVEPKLPPAGDLVTKPIFHKEIGKKGFLTLKHSLTVS